MYSFLYGRLVFLPLSFPLFSSPRPFHRFPLFLSYAHRSPFSLRSTDIPFLVLFSIGFLFCRTATFVTLFLLFGILRASLRLFSLVPSACPSRLLYEVIMYRIRYHLIAILGIEKSLVVTVPNTGTIYFRCENFHIFFPNEDICLTILRNVCSTLSRILTSEEFTLEIRDNKRSTGR